MAKASLQASVVADSLDEGLFRFLHEVGILDERTEVLLTFRNIEGQCIQHSTKAIELAKAAHLSTGLLVIAMRKGESAPFRHEQMDVGYDLLKILSGPPIIIQVLVLRIDHIWLGNPVFVEIRVPLIIAGCEDAYSIPLRPVLRMMHEWCQQGRQILLPQPGTVEEDTLHFIIFLSCGKALMSEDGDAQPLQWLIGRIVRVVDRPQVVIEDLSPRRFRIGRSAIDNFHHAVPRLGIELQQAVAKHRRLQMLYRMADQLGQRVVSRHHPCAVRDAASEWIVACNMTGNVDNTTDIRIIEGEPLVLPEQSLRQRPLQILGEEVDEKVEDRLVITAYGEVEDVAKEDLLEEIVEEVVLFGIWRESGADCQIDVLEAQEADNVACDDACPIVTSPSQRVDVLGADLVVLLLKVEGEKEHRWPVRNDLTYRLGGKGLELRQTLRLILPDPPVTIVMADQR